MYQLRYADIQTDSQMDAKERERAVIERSIELLCEAQAQGSKSFAAVEAIHYTMRVWSAFMEDLARDENQLPKELRASLISIGIWILKEAEAIRMDPAKDFESLIDISRIIIGGIDEKHA